MVAERNHMKRNLPTWLTVLRIGMLPVLICVFYLGYDWSRPVSCFIFIIAGITDWLDGYLARLWNVESRFGAFLDPVADKLMVATALILIVEFDSSMWLTIPAIVIIGREITISALREWMAEMGQRGKVKVGWLGKAIYDFWIINCIYESQIIKPARGAADATTISPVTQRHRQCPAPRPEKPGDQSARAGKAQWHLAGNHLENRKWLPRDQA